MVNAIQIKEKIISFINSKGPSLPVHVAKETGLSILFASAFLSELLNEKRLKISNLKIGTSPLYFIPGQEPLLENFSKYLKNKEKEAFLLIQEKRFLEENKLEPAIRVAIKSLKDFAFRFEKQGKIYWRYFLNNETELNEKEKTPEEIAQEEIIKKEEPPTEKIKFKETSEEKIRENEKVEEIPKEENKEKKIEEIFEKEEIKKEKSKKTEIKPPKKKSKKKSSKKKDENFFNKIKEYLEKENVEIIDIIDFKNEEAILKTRKQEKEEITYIFNRKRISDKDIIKSYKKALDYGLNYNILAMGEAPKKLIEFISAIRNMSKLGKIN